MNQAKNPLGRTGITGLGSLSDAGQNDADYLFIISPSYVLVKDFNFGIDVPIDYHPYAPASLRKKINGEFCKIGSYQADSVLNTGKVILYLVKFFHLNVFIELLSELGIGSADDFRCLSKI